MSSRNELPDEKIVEFRNVSFTYPGRDEPALEDISFSLEKGSRVLILGSNGSGKSTVTRLMTGLLRPERGEVKTFGLSTDDRKNLRSIRTGAGLLFQNPSSQIVAAVVREDTAFGPENLALSGEEIRCRVENALRKTGLHPLRRRAAHDLSAGQQQRLAMAGVLALGSGCLILDEAAAMLNPSARQEIGALLDHLHANGATIIQVSHFMDQIARADHILVLHQGRLVLNGDRDEFLHRAADLVSWSLKVPAVQALSREIGRFLPGVRTVVEEELLAADLKTILGKSALPEGDGPIGADPDGKRNNFPLLFSLKDVSYQYNIRSGKPIDGLRHVDLDYHKDETLVLMGATGSGKSTLLQVLNALLLPTEGRISLLGENPLDRNCDLARLRTRIGLVMQQPEKQLFAPLVGDDVAFGPRQMGIAGKDLSLRVKEALELMGLPYAQFRDRSIRALSGGQKRKVALAGILAMRPECLLLDEPTAGLDPGAAEDLEELLFRLRSEGINLILTTHDVEQAIRFDPRLVVMAEGQKVFDGSPEMFFREHDPVRFGLEYPLTLRLWRSAVSSGNGPVPLTEEQLTRQVMAASGTPAYREGV